MEKLDGKIKELATKFRSAIEKADRVKLPEQFEAFPRGCCWDVAMLLSHFLQRHGYGPFDLITGERKSLGETTWQSHAWLEKNDLIVDITADQFGGFPAPVIVSKDSNWHQIFFIDNGIQANLETFFDARIREMLLKSYDIIAGNMGA